MVLSRPQWLKVAPTCCSHRGECQHMCEHRMFRECLSQELRASQEGHSVGRASLGQGLPWSLRGTYIAYFCVHSLASLFYMGLAWAGRCPWEPGQLHTKPTLRGRILRSVGLVSVGYFWHEWVIRVGVAEQRADRQEKVCWSADEKKVSYLLSDF